MQSVYLIALLLVLAGALGWRLIVSVRQRQAAERDLRLALLSSLSGALDDVVMLPVTTAGVLSFSGTRHGATIRVQTITDTLALRKLPSWWLSVTVHEPMATPAILDVMMRPDMVASFSNFHLRPERIPTPPGLPALCALRADRRDVGALTDIVADNASLFFEPRTKELLISPNGVRIVCLMAEADRVRYGVFRQADFKGQIPSPGLIGRTADRAIAICRQINDRQELAA